MVCMVLRECVKDRIGNSCCVNHACAKKSIKEVLEIFYFN